jgi:hypothetical protein
VGGTEVTIRATHEKGIGHRDLKPGNVKIKPDGTGQSCGFRPGQGRRNDYLLFVGEAPLDRPSVPPSPK